MECRSRITKGLSMLLMASVVSTSVLAGAVAVRAEDSSQNESKAAPSPYVLWYDTPAPDTDAGWENLTLPIGNGYLGARIFGGIETEKIQFNEETLWNGGPGTGVAQYTWMGIVDNAWEYLDDAQAEVFSNDFKGARNIVSENILRTTGESYQEYNTEVLKGKGMYQDFGELYLDFEIDESKAADYRRELDISNAVAGVSFEADGITYSREYFTSYPKNVMVVRFSADQKGAVTVNVRPQVSDPDTKTNTTTVEGDTITLKGTLNDNGMKYESQFKVIAENGQITPETESVRVDGADSVTIIMAAGTDYKNEYPTYKGDDPHEAVSARIAEAAKLDYDALKKEHVEDYRKIFSRVEMNIGQIMPDIPTDVYLDDYRAGSEKYDPKAMEVLLFQFGRYLLISSSRDGTLPSNAQGVWNKDYEPIWQSDFHFNINLQMMYWPAFVTNMAECADPLIDYIESITEPGHVTAQEFFGAEEEDAWAILTGNTPTGFVGSSGHISSWAPTNAAWICQNLWDYYEYTGDKEKLESQIYPIMRGAVLLYKDLLVEDPRYGGRLVIAPSYSPEHGPVTGGTTYDQELVWQLYTDFLEAAEVLGKDTGEDSELYQTVSVQRDKLEPLHINESGMIKEWIEEDGQKIDGVEKNHRHQSHLLGLYPGDHITAETPELMEAAIKSLEDRGPGGTGWSRAHKLNLWARTGNGEEAYKQLQSLLKGEIVNGKVAGIMDNMLDSHPPFQIDGNFGATAGIAEMLIQSHTEYIEPLPALPKAWEQGEVSGLVTEGGFETVIRWSNNELTELELTSTLGNECRLKYTGIGNAKVTDSGGNSVTTESESQDKLSFQTKKGETYRVEFAESELASIEAAAETEIVSKGERTVINVTGILADGRKTDLSSAKITYQPESGTKAKISPYGIVETVEIETAEFKVEAEIDGKIFTDTVSIQVVEPEPMRLECENMNYTVQGGNSPLSAGSGADVSLIFTAGTADDKDPVGDYIEFATPRVRKGTYKISFVHRYYSDRANVQFSIDGEEIGSVINLSSSSLDNPLELGEIEIAETGTHTIRITVAEGEKSKIGANAFIIEQSGDIAPYTDLTGLEEQIKSAQELLDSAVIGTEEGQYPETAAQALREAVCSAIASMKENLEITEEEAAAEIKELAAAVQSFESSKIAGQEEKLLADTEDSSEYYKEISGEWKSSSVSGYDGGGSRYSLSKTASVEWYPVVAEEGTYRVRIYHPVHSSDKEHTVKIEVISPDGRALYEKEYEWSSADQAGWIDLGTYSGMKPGKYTVRLTKLEKAAPDGMNNQVLRADAVEFVRTSEISEMPAGTYYVDASMGDDANSGTSPDQAWKTLEKVNSIQFKPGSSILLKKGENWTGKLSPKGSGTQELPNLLGSYGEGDQRPVINGGGCENGAVELSNQEYWEINGLEVTNYQDGETLGDRENNKTTRHGIYITLENFDAGGDHTAESIHVRDCYVHDVFGNISNPHSGVGIFFFVSGAEDKSRFNDVLIEENELRNIDRSGIIIRSQDISDPDTTYNTNVVIQKNYLESIAGDGIVAKVSKGALIQHNEINSACVRSAGNNAACWVWQCKDAVIQYNEVYNTGLVNGNLDGQAFDSDYNSIGTIIQYNYSHDNDGGFVLVIAPEKRSYNVGTIIRYNISENDSKDVFEISGEVDNAAIYNNTVYQDEEHLTTLLRVNTYWGVSKSAVFCNNIFYSKGEGVVLEKTDNGRPLRGNITFDNNAFYGFAVPESVDRDVNEGSYTGHWKLTVTNSVTEDPKLADPGSGITGIDFSDPNRLSGYWLGEGSSCLNAGKNIENNGNMDFWGNTLYSGQADIGAFESSGETGRSVQDIANGITMLENPEPNDRQLKMPQIPEGFTVSIKTSSNEKVIDLQGQITTPVFNTPITLVLTVSDGSVSADTRELVVTVPGNPEYRNALIMAVDDAEKKISSGEYADDEAMKIYKSALENAKALLEEGADASNADYIAAKEALEDAADRLVPVSNTGQEPDRSEPEEPEDAANGDNSSTEDETEKEEKAPVTGDRIPLLSGAAGILLSIVCIGSVILWQKSNKSGQKINSAHRKEK